MGKLGGKPQAGEPTPPLPLLAAPLPQGWAHGAETRDVAAEGLYRPPTKGLLQQGHRELSGLAHCAGGRPGVHYWHAGSGAHSFRNRRALGIFQGQWNTPSDYSCQAQAGPVYPPPPLLPSLAG